MELELDFLNVAALESMHLLLKKKFGFPEFYGNNVNALIDCLTSLRYPDDGMTTVTIGKDERLTMIIKSFPINNGPILNHFMHSITAVNKRYLEKQQSAPISLIFT